MTRRSRRHFGLTLDPPFATRLEAALAEAGGHQSRHRYALAEYGLDERWLQDQLGEVLAAYGFRARATEPSG
jgi:hypothetical protein